MFGCCCGCNDDGSHKVDEFANVTRISYNLDGEGFDAPGAPQSVSYEVCDDGISPVSPAPQWRFEPCAAGSGETVSQIADNCYERTGNKVNFFRAEKVGFKNVLARKAWHGRYPFNTVCACPTEVSPQVRYLTIERSVVYKITNRHWKYPYGGGAGPFEFFTGETVTYKARVTVDRESGVWTVSNFERSYIVTQRTYAEAENEPPALETIDWYSIYNTADELSARLAQFVYCGGWQNDSIYTSDPSITLANAKAYDIWQHLIALDVNGGNFGDGTPTAGTTSNPAFGREWPGHEKVVTGTRVSGSAQWGIENFPYGDGNTFDQYQGFYFEARLSDPYTSSDVLDDLIGLAAQFPLNDDKAYPWRTDEYGSVAPLLSRKEKIATSPDMGAVGFAYFAGDGPVLMEDASADTFTGEVLGIPLPAGYQGFWNQEHCETECCDGGYGTSTVYCATKGAMSGTGPGTGQFVPATATQWIDNNFARFLYGGAYIYGEYDGYCWLQKHAETLLTWPNYNFGGPCGKVRGYLEWQTSKCIESEAGTVLAMAEATALTNGTVCYVPSLGIVSIAVTDAGMTVTCTVLHATVPLWFEDDLAENRLWKLPWYGKRGICGQPGVVSATNSSGTQVTLTVSEDVFLLVGDTVDFAGVAGLGSGVAVVAVDDDLRTITVAGQLSPAEYAGGGKIKSPGNAFDAANLTTLNTDAVTAHYVKQTWETDEYDAETGWGFTHTIDAATKTCRKCIPTVLCFSPNGETFENGTTYAMPTSMFVDACYGYRWHGGFTQAVSDPLRDMVRQPGCGAYSRVEPDNGSCLADGTDGDYIAITYAAMPMLVSPRLSLPSGAGAPPTGVMAKLTPSADAPLTAGSDCPHDLAATGGIWATWLRLRASVANAECRFRSDYAKWFKPLGQCPKPVAPITADSTTIKADSTTVTAASGS